MYDDKMVRAECVKERQEVEANPHSQHFVERGPPPWQQMREEYDRVELQKALKLEQEKLEPLQLQSAKKVLRDLKLHEHECYHTRGKAAKGKCHKKNAVRRMRELDLPPPMILLVLSLAGVDVVRECEEGNLPELAAWVLKKEEKQEED
jgi:hypothetical protein